MVLAISAKISRDQQPVNDLTISIDHTSGYFFITENDVLAAIDELLPESGSMLHTKDLKVLESKLRDLPQAERSNAFVNNSGQLSIEVIQRKPLYRVIRQNGSSYYVDRNGVKFPVSRKYTARVPVATGQLSDNCRITGPLVTESEQELFTLFEALAGDKFWSAQFGQVQVNEAQEFELIPRVGDQVVLVGDASDIDSKLKNLRIFYHEGIERAGWDTYRTINLKFKDQVVCKK